jgi:leucyl aminopeptidase (aminopeptidase T)
MASGVLSDYSAYMKHPCRTRHVNNNQSVIVKYQTQQEPKQTFNITVMKKNKTFVLTLISTALFAAGCDKGQRTSQQVEQVKSETKEAARDLKDYTFEEKAKFTGEMQSQLTELKKSLDQLDAKIEKASDTVKAEAKPKLQSLHEKADQLGKQLESATTSTESTWNTVKTDSKKAYDELKDGVTQARQWASDKIAP